MQSPAVKRRYFAWGGHLFKSPASAFAFLRTVALHLIFTITNKGLAEMKYMNANAILPEELIAEIQQYIQGETIYIPKPETAHYKWGTRSGGRKVLDDRNRSIKRSFKSGKKIQELAEEFYLSAETIKKIVYTK
jgi:Mor family transcriptional regulator